MTKGPDAFRTISEVAEELNIPQHVLRFWETRFVQIKPVKRGGGRRFYRPDDVALLRGIRHLLYGAGYTIRGVQRILKERGIAHVQSIGLSQSGGTGQAVPLEQHGEYSGDSTGASPDASVPPEAEAQMPAPFPIQAGSLYHGGPSPQDNSDINIDSGVELSDAPLHEDAPSLHEEPASAIDPLISRYAPGPLSARSDRLITRRDEAVPDQLIQPHYTLTTDTRNNLQEMLEEIRECRRLLGSVLNGQSE